MFELAFQLERLAGVRVRVGAVGGGGEEGDGVEFSSSVESKYAQALPVAPGSAVESGRGEGARTPDGDTGPQKEVAATRVSEAGRVCWRDNVSAEDARRFVEELRNPNKQLLAQVEWFI